jgi:hypothetical protein
MYKVFDDLLPSSLVDRIEQTLSDDYFNWFALDNLSLGNQEEKYNFTYKDGYKYIDTHGMSSLIYKNDTWFESYGMYMMSRQIIDYVCEAENINLNRILRIKANFLTQNVDHSFDEMCINFPHTDNYSDHNVLVYYVNDTDGDTILFNQKFAVDDDKKDNIELTTAVRVQPKRGRILMFDGLHYHTSQNPLNATTRMILNINFV